jgi:hypothetical protein
MGVPGVFNSKSSNDSDYYSVSNNSLNPDPSNFRVLRSLKKGNVILLEIKYPNCTNYEGHKIIVMDSLMYELSVKHLGKLDPHFSDKGQTVIARFEPSIRGWEMAKEFIEKCDI